MMASWRIVLKMPKETDDLFAMHKVGKIFVLPEIISGQIKRFKDLDAELYLGWRKDLTEAFKQIRFDTNFAHFADRLSDSLLVSIKFCDHELGKRLPEKKISREDLDALRTEVWALYTKVLESDIGPPIDRYLLDRIFALIEAIDDYEITGAVAIEKVLNEAVGTIATSTDMAKASRRTQAGTDFWKILARVSFILAIAKSAAELTEKVQALLAE